MMQSFATRPFFPSLQSCVGSPTRCWSLRLPLPLRGMQNMHTQTPRGSATKGAHLPGRDSHLHATPCPDQYSVRCRVGIGVR